MFRLGNKTADEMYAEARRNLGMVRTGRLKRSFSAGRGVTIRLTGVKEFKENLDAALSGMPAKFRAIEAEYEVIDD